MLPAWARQAVRRGPGCGRSYRGPAAVDDQDLAGHAAGGADGQEQQRPVDLFQGQGAGEQGVLADGPGEAGFARTRQLRPPQPLPAEFLPIFSRDVSRRIAANDESWEIMGPL